MDLFYYNLRNHKISYVRTTNWLLDEIIMIIRLRVESFLKIIKCNYLDLFDCVH